MNNVACGDVMNTLKLFGKRIKELRKSKNLTQEQLGELVGIDGKQIGNIETGAYFTTITTLEKIALILEVEIEELFKFAHNKNKAVLIDELILLLNVADEEKIRLLYRIARDVLK